MKTEDKTDNELIAEFMGFISHESETYGIILQHPDLIGTYQDHTRQNQHGKAMKLEYQTSWDWLMPVVEKIESLKFEVNVCKNSCLIMNDPVGVSEPITNANLPYDRRFEYQASGTKDSKIECTYQAVIAFIKWYSALDGTKL